MTIIDPMVELYAPSTSQNDVVALNGKSLHDDFEPAEGFDGE